MTFSLLPFQFLYLVLIVVAVVVAAVIDVHLWGGALGTLGRGDLLGVASGAGLSLLALL